MNGGATESKPLVVTIAHVSNANNQSRTLASLIRTQPLYSRRIYNADEPAPPSALKRNA